jgi:hypothetical protein
MQQLSDEELVQISGGADDYPYLEKHVGPRVALAFMAGALGSGLALGGAFVVGGLMLVDSAW